MIKPVVAGNWKMHGSKSSIEQLLNGLTSDDFSAVADIIVCPPSPYLTLASAILDASKISVSAQNVSEHESGAYTGEYSAQMLVDCGCTHTLIGHSERRAYYHENNTLVGQKFFKALDGGLVPIFCVGETENEKRSGLTETIIREQLAPMLKNGGNLTPGRFIIAYEPVWAIGTGLVPEPEAVQQVHGMIRQQLATVVNAQDVPILYGGSLKPSNAAAIFELPDVNGGLVGGASLDVNQFLGIIRCIK